MLVAEKGTMGVGSSRMSGVNNVALWIGKQASEYVPFINIAPVVAGTNGISPIFLTTVGVTGGIGLDLKNWVKKKDADGNVVRDADGEPVLEQEYSIDTGSVFTINTKEKKLYKDGKVVKDVSAAFTPQKVEFMRAGGSYAVVFGKKLQTFAAKVLGIEAPQVYAASKEISEEGQGLTAVEKIFNKNAVGTTPGKVLHAGSDVRVEVNIVGSQDTTGLMTSQELEMMAATVISPIVDGAYQSGCHTASVWDKKAQANIPKLMKFMNDFGLITARDPGGQYHAMTDVIHKVLNDITVDDAAIIIGGDSHTRMSKGVAFGADSGTVALALATGEASMPIPESVKVTFKGKMADHMDFRDVVHATQAADARPVRRRQRLPGSRDRGAHRHSRVRSGLHLHRLDGRDEGEGLHLHLRGRNSHQVARNRQEPHRDHDQEGHGQREEGPPGPRQPCGQAHRGDSLRRQASPRSRRQREVLRGVHGRPRQDR